MTKKILVTGGAGFVGRSLVKFMLEISMSDGIWFPYELKMIRKIGSELQIVEEKVEWLIFSVHASYKILLEI